MVPHGTQDNVRRAREADYSLPQTAECKLYVRTAQITGGLPLVRGKASPTGSPCTPLHVSRPPSKGAARCRNAPKP